MHNLALAILLGACLLASPPSAAAADHAACARALGQIQAFVERAATIDDWDDWYAHRKTATGILDHFAAAGYRRPFVARQLTALAHSVRMTHLRIFDLNDPKFREFLDPREDREVLEAIRKGGDYLGGLFFLTKRGGNAVFVIAVDAASKEVPFEDALIEEVLHLRMRLFQLVALGAATDQGERPPYLIRPAARGLTHMFDEFVAKETLNVIGLGQPRDRAHLLRDLSVEIGVSPSASMPGYAQLCVLLIAAARAHGSTWDRVPLAQVIRFAFTTTARELSATTDAPDADGAFLDLIKSTNGVPRADSLVPAG